MRAPCAAASASSCPILKDSLVPEIYVSTDIEADGPIPGPNSMLSFASAAFLADGTQLSTFTANLVLLDGASGDPKTMTWWGRLLVWLP